MSKILFFFFKLLFLLCLIFTLSNAKHGGKYWNRSRGKLDSKGPQAKTTEPMNSIKVTYCSIQLGRILAHNGFAKNYMGSRPEAKKCHFYFIQCEAWAKVLESVSRQARLQRVLRERLQNRWTQLKSHIVVFN